MLNTPFNPTTWTEFFVNHPSHDEFNDNIPTLFSSFNDTQTITDCFSAASSTPQIPHLILEPIHKDIIIIHNFGTSQGNLLHRHTTHFVHASISSNVALPLTLNLTNLFHLHTSVPRPSITDLAAATSLQNIATITIDTAPNNNGTAPTIKLRNTIPIPPFLIDTIIQCPTPKPDHILLAVLHKIQAIDTATAAANNTNNNNTQTLVTICTPLLHWLHAATNSNIQPVNSSPLLTPAETQISNTIHRQHLHLSTTPSTPLTTPQRTTTTPTIPTTPNLQLDQTDVLSRLADALESRSSSTSKSFASLAQSTKSLLLNMASPDHQNAAHTLPSTAYEFFKCKNTSQAIAYLEAELHSLNIFTKIPPPFAHSLLHGKFTWDSYHTPSGLAASTILPNDPQSTFTSTADIIILDLKSQRQNIDDETISKLSKQQVIFPSHFSDVRDTFTALNGIIQIIAGHESYIYNAIDTFIAQLTSSHQRLTYQASQDKYFIAKLMVSFDDRLNQWLQKCQYTPIQSVPAHLIDFAKILEHVHLNCFHYRLPNSIRTLVSTPEPFNHSRKRKADDPSDTPLLSPPPAKRTLIRNEHPDPRWAFLPNETWEDIKGKCTTERPRVQGKQVCTRFLLRHFCHQNCPCFHDKITSEHTAKAIDKHLQKIRSIH